MHEQLPCALWCVSCAGHGQSLLSSVTLLRDTSRGNMEPRNHWRAQGPRTPGLHPKVCVCASACAEYSGRGSVALTRPQVFKGPLKAQQHWPMLIRVPFLRNTKLCAWRGTVGHTKVSSLPGVRQQEFHLRLRGPLMSGLGQNPGSIPHCGQLINTSGSTLQSEVTPAS